MTRQPGRFHFEYCKKCGGRRQGQVDFMTARYEVTFPFLCSRKDQCEREIISALQITACTSPTGEIIR